MKVTAALSVLLCCAAIRAGEGRLRVIKCCRDDEYLDVATEMCHYHPALQATAGKRFDPLWLPEWLRAEPELQVKYIGIYRLHRWQFMGQDRPAVWLHPEERLVRRLLAVDADARRFVLEPFGDGVDERAVANQKVCFDVTRDPRRPIVVGTWLENAMLQKCCPQGARLDARLQCDSQSVRSLQDFGADFDLPLDAIPWLPAHLRDVVPVVDVFYAAWWVASNIEGALVDADDPSAWKLLFARPQEDWMQAVWVRAGEGVVGASTDFCFDATEADSGLPAHALVARVAHVTKCCRRGQQLEAREMQCMPRADMEVDTRLTELLAPDDPSAYWLPRALAADGMPVPVRYQDDWNELFWRLVFPAERAQVVRFPDRPPAACVRMRKPSGREHVACTSDFCFDAMDRGSNPRVLAVGEFDDITVVTVQKCCRQDQMLHEEAGLLGTFPKIRCQPDTSEDWTPENSPLADELLAERLYIAQPVTECLDQAFTLVKDAPERTLNKLVGVGYPGRFNVRFYCKDLLRGSDGGPARDVLAFCEMPAAADLFVKVRPLHVVAAVLLLLAVGSVLAQPKLRSNTHGRALVCHAACLMAANVLQAVWFFTHYFKKPCDGFAYAIYFFLVGGAFWLNVISVNMTLGFRHTQGARSREGGSDGQRRWRLALLYAWGLPAALTAVCIAAHQWEEEAQRLGLVTPTFFETRTCFVEEHYQSRDLQGNSVEESRLLGAVYYYYLPCGALVAANAVCLVMTLCRIRTLRRDAPRLQREPGHVQSALLYVKLLLTAGVLELALEAALWAFRPHVTKSRKSHYHAQHVSYIFSSLGSFLDVARALAVLWLAVGRCKRAQAVWRSLCARIHSHSPNAAAGTASGPAGKPTPVATTSGSPTIESVRL